MLLVCMHSYLKSVLRHTFLILDTNNSDKDVRIRGKVSKSKGVHEQKRPGNTGLEL